MIKLFVGGFSLDITELELVQLFDPYCRVVTIKIVRDKKTRVCKGYAFLEVATEQDAENAVRELDGAQIGDRSLTVNIVREDEVKKKPAPAFTRRPFAPRPTGTSNAGREPGQATSREPGQPAGMRPKRPRK